MNWTEQQKKSVWNRARSVDGHDPQRWRKDCCGAWIEWNKYGDNNSIYGWEIDHIFPISEMEKHNIPKEEMHDPKNLRAMQHSNNASKGDDYPEYTSCVTAEGDINVEKNRNLTVNEKAQEDINTLYWWYLLDDDDIDHDL